MRLIYTAIIILTFLLIQPAMAGISISQSVDKTEIAFTDTVTFEVLLNWDGPQFKYRFDRPLDPQFISLKVVGFTSAISSEGVGEDEVTTKRFSYRLIPTLSGTGRVDPIEIGYVTYPDSLPGELLTEEMRLIIAKPIAKNEEESSSIWLYIVGCIILLGIGVTGFVIYKRSQNDHVTMLSPKEKFLDELASIKRESGSDMKKFQYQLHTALTEFVKMHCSVDPVGMDIETLKTALNKAKLTDEASNKISSWLIQAERDKYQPIQTAPGDTIRLESEIRTLFEKI